MTAAPPVHHFHLDDISRASLALYEKFCRETRQVDWVEPDANALADYSRWLANDATDPAALVPPAHVAALAQLNRIWFEHAGEDNEYALSVVNRHILP